MSPSDNLLHLSPHCHWVYFSILLLYFLVPPASALSSRLISTAAVTGAAWSLFPSCFSLCLLVPHPHQLRGPGVPRLNPPSSRVLGGHQEFVTGEGPLTAMPPSSARAARSPACLFSTLDSAPRGCHFKQRRWLWPGLPPTEPFTRPPCLIS